MIVIRVELAILVLLVFGIVMTLERIAKSLEAISKR
jgi:hypothetical protein